MKKFAEVISIPESGVAKVRIRRHSSCGNCGKCDNGAKVEVLVTDTIGVEKGDIVALTISDSSLVGAALLIYLIPLVAFFAGYLLLTYLEVASEGIKMLSGAVLFGAALLLARYVGKRNQSEYELEIKSKV